MLFRSERRNHYKPWLPYAFRLGLQTGTRAEELVVLKWRDLVVLEDGVEIFKISNRKVNRIKSGTDTGKYVRNVPITDGLRALLMELGINEKRGSDEYVIPRNGQSTKYMMQIISRGFAHFIKLATARKVQFKDLRKTYITMMTKALGTSAKMFTGHANDEIIQNHYLSSAYLAGSLSGFKVF